VIEQRYEAVLAVIANGRTVGEVASEWGVCRQTMHRWLARDENDGLEASAIGRVGRFTARIKRASRSGRPSPSAYR